MWQLTIDDRLYVSGLTTAEALALLRSLRALTPALVALRFDTHRQK